jgi:pimeloyl-ACP methyl ester carboxylesterase
MLNAVIYVAAGKGPHPTLLLLHGFPGNEQNLDLAQAARRAGWNVLTLHYRGSWGSPGPFPSPCHRGCAQCRALPA